MIVEYVRLKHEFGITVGHKNRPLYIQLDWPLRRSLAMTAMTILHEMVHVEDMRGTGHGPRFHKRMLQLAKAKAFNKWW
jgi:hypothetical protein